MKDDLQHIEELYRDAIIGQEFEPTVSFKTRISFLLMYLQIRKIFILLLILIGITIGVYFGYSSIINGELHQTNHEAIISNEVSENIAIVEDESNPSFTEDLSVSDIIEMETDAYTVDEKVTKEPAQILDAYLQTGEVSSSDKKYDINTISVMNSKEAYYISVNSSDLNLYESNISPVDIDGIFSKNMDEIEPPIISENTLKKARIFSLSLYGSPSITMAGVKVENGDNKYLNIRKDGESPALSWAVGGDIQIHLKNWFIQTGINYSVYRNNKNYNYNYQLLDSANSYFNYDTVWVWIYDPPNLEYPVMVGIDTTWVPVYKDINVYNRGTNQWSYLEIPILVGYQFNYRKFDFEIATGISIGFLMNYSGSLPHFPDVEGMDNIDKLDNNINRTMYNYLLQLGMIYNFSKKWSILTQPYFKQNLQSVFDNKYPVNQRFSAVGLNVGLRVRF